MVGQEATRYEIKDGAAWITLNRPENRNALSAILVNELYAHLIASNEKPEVRSIVITGTGPAFCAGADLKSPPGQLVDGAQGVTYPEVLNTILESPKPVIAAVNGAAFAGGLGLVGAADIVVPKLGTHHAMKLFLTGERFTGEQAVGMGFAHRAVTAEELTSAVQEEIDAINLGGPIAVQECKKLVRRVRELSIRDGFNETADWSKRLFQSEEGTEGMAAFREKRKPNWVRDQ